MIRIGASLGAHPPLCSEGLTDPRLAPATIGVSGPEIGFLTGAVKRESVGCVVVCLLLFLVGFRPNLAPPGLPGAGGRHPMIRIGASLWGSPPALFGGVDRPPAGTGDDYLT